MKNVILIRKDIDDPDTEDYIIKIGIEGSFPISELIGRTIEWIEESENDLKITLKDL